MYIYIQSHNLLPLCPIYMYYVVYIVKVTLHLELYMFKVTR